MGYLNLRRWLLRRLLDVGVLEGVHLPYGICKWVIVLLLLLHLLLVLLVVSKVHEVLLLLLLLRNTLLLISGELVKLTPEIVFLRLLLLRRC